MGFLGSLAGVAGAGGALAGLPEEAVAGLALAPFVGGYLAEKAIPGQPFVPSAANSPLKGFGTNTPASPGNFPQGTIPSSSPTISSSGPYTTSGTSGSGSVVDPAVAAYFGQQIGQTQSQIDALDPQLQVGLGNIASSYNKGVNAENTSYAKGTRDYNTSRGNTIQDELTAKGNIDTGVRQNTNALQRLLGLAGSGNSSASQILAPYAAGREGNIQRGQVQTAYGRNLQGLDTAYGDTTSAHNSNLTDLGEQRFSNEQGLKSGIEQNRASLLNTLAGLTLQQGQAAGESLPDAQAAAAPYMSQITGILQSLAQLGSQYQNPISLQTPSVYTAPDLSSYSYDSSKAPSLAGAPAYGDAITPYLPPKDKTQQILTA